MATNLVGYCVAVIVFAFAIRTMCHRMAISKKVTPEFLVCLL
jgi:hypothetical protein